jgi:hypothetical protein
VVGACVVLIFAWGEGDGLCCAVLCCVCLGGEWSGADAGVGAVVVGGVYVAVL